LDFGPPIQERKKPARRRRDDDDEDDEDSRPRYEHPDDREKPPVWLTAVGLLPLIIAIPPVGGLIGMLFGIAAACINMAVARQRGLAVPARLGIVLAVTVLAVVLDVIAVLALFKALNGR
jgi:hypothetical protein